MVEALESTLNSYEQMISKEQIISKPVELTYEFVSPEGFPMKITNKWILEYLNDSKVFCFYDGGSYHFDAKTGNYLGQTKPRLNKKMNTYFKTPQKLNGEVVNKFIQIYDALLKSIVDVGLKAKKAGYFKNDISNECGEFLGKMREERSNIFYYLLENAYNDYSKGVEWNKSSLAGNEEIALHKGFKDDEQVFGIKLFGKHFDNRKKSVTTLFASNPTRYNLEDIKTITEDALGPECDDVKNAALLSIVNLEKILSNFKSSIKEEDKKQLLIDKLSKMYKQNKAYSKELLSETPTLTQNEMAEYKTSYEFYKQRASLSLLKSVLVMDNCREIVDEKVEKKSASISSKKGGVKGPALNGAQKNFKECLNELKGVLGKIKVD
ncbi:MAG: hypothetical protein WC393_02315 [Candidatus Nanoarchaeia archaeon]|jgi:hypothetical protein